MADRLDTPRLRSPNRSGLWLIIRRVIILLGLLYLCAILLLYFAQRKLLYFPFGENPTVLATRARQVGFAPWTNQLGTAIGWFRLNRSGMPGTPVLVFHGNGGSAVDRVYLADELQREQPLDLYLIEYPGYAGRAGTPSQESLFAAAREAFEAASRNGKVYLVGESLGTGVASYLAGNYSSNVAGLFLIAPFNSLAAAASSHYPIFPTGLILKDTYRSDTFLQTYSGPLAVILAGHDEVVPNHLGRKLFDDYGGPKRLWVNPSASHNSVSQLDESTRQEILSFLLTGKMQ